MKSAWKVGRVAGIDLCLHPTFLLLLAWFALQGGVEAMILGGLVFGCVVLHEYGHAFAARVFGIATHNITLYPIGGVARLERMPRAPGAELLITLAGPAVNVLIAAALFLGLRIANLSEPTLIGVYAANLAAINVFLAIFNMLPAFPLDGGRVLRACLSGPLGRLRATEAAAALGQILAVALPLVLLVFGAFSPLNLVLSLFLFWAAGAELAHVRAESHRRDHSAGIWTARPGHRWVSRGGGVWQQIPIVIPVRVGNPSPWR